MRFSVWAPTAESLHLVAGEQRIAMDQAEQGYWQTEAELPADQGYRFSVNGGAPMPDPRSRWQRDGIHGPSFAVAAAAAAAPFAAAPLSEAVIYELHVGTFTPEGTYAAARGKLGHLQALGITHVELLPLASFPGRHGWGYDGVDLYAPHPAYGTPPELLQLVRACHAHGMAVLLDVVYNHLGPDGNYLGQFAPYFTDHYKTGWGAAINYDGAHSDQVRRYVIDNALMWLRDYEFDGLRLDAVHAIYSFQAMHVLEELAAAVRQASRAAQRTLVLIAESDLNDPRLVLPVAKGGYGLDAHWEDDFHHALHRFFTGETAGYYADFDGLGDVAKALRDGYVYQGQYSAFRQRRHGRPPRGVAGAQIVVSAQNHDQIGNRALGERLSMLLDAPKLKAIAALTVLAPFVPMLFQGEEWGARTPFQYFTDHQDAELGRLVAEGRAREFNSFKWQVDVPNPQDEATFLRSKLDWSELAQGAHADLLEWYRQLIKLRRAKLRGGPGRAKARVKFNAKLNWLSFVHGGVLVCCNFADYAQCLPVWPGEWQPVMNSDGGSAQLGDQQPPSSTRIFKQRPA